MRKATLLLLREYTASREQALKMRRMDDVRYYNMVIQELLALIRDTTPCAAIQQSPHTSQRPPSHPQSAQVPMCEDRFSKSRGPCKNWSEA